MINEKREMDYFKAKINDYRELLEIGKSLNSHLKYATLLDSLLLTCMGRATVDKAGLFIRHDITSKEFTLYRNYEGFNPDRNIHYAIDEKSEVLNTLKKSKSCVTMPELLSDIKEISDIKPFTILEPSLIVPIIMKVDIQGMIVLGGRIGGRSFTEAEFDFLRCVADFGAIAIHNTFLLEVSSTDMMTKLKLRHILFQTMKTLFAKKRNEQICILMIDIDKFKNLNDSYGHTFGDQVIKEIASILLASIRMEDMAARYGGEEFTILLRGLNLNIAYEVANRIRLSVEKTQFKCEETLVKTTISVGLAQYDPSKDRVPQDLVKRADSALYKAKREGRNRVESA